MRSRSLLAAIVGCVILAVGLAIWLSPFKPPAEQQALRATPAKVRVAFQAGRYEAAAKLSRELLDSDDSQISGSSRADLLMMLGESETKLENWQAALDAYRQVEDTSEKAATARWASGEIYFHLGQASEATESLNAAIALNRFEFYAHQRLAYLYNTFGRRSEAQPHLQMAIKSGQFTPQELMLVGNPAKAYDAPEEVKRFLSADPDDLLPTLGTIVTHNNELRHREALEVLEPLLKQQPELVEAHVQKGIALLATAPQLLPEWHAELPKAADEHPEVWVLRSQMFDANVDAAIRCCVKAVELNPIHLVAHTRLANLLARSGCDEEAAKIAERAEKLQEVNIGLEQIYEAPGFAAPMESVARLCIELGRKWEAAHWTAYAAGIDRNASWTNELLAVLKPNQTLSQNTPFVDTSALTVVLAAAVEPTKPLDLGRLNRPLEIAPAKTGNVAEAEIPPIRLTEVAGQLGVDFTFDNNTKNAGDGRKMFETTGGGAGTLDYDNDGWPDLYFAQAGSIDGDTELSDELYRNVTVNSGVSETQTGKAPLVRSFESVTGQAKIIETAFSQGIAAGDADGDGFDDVYVCNVGRNTLFLNQGDGTFVDATSSLVDNSSAWTSSAAIVDFSGDGLPEIYDANYVTGPDVRTRVCQVDGKPRGCSPLVFSPCVDVLHVSNAAGQFVSQPGSVPADALGNSLGVSAFCIAGDELPSLFVSVDQQANLLLRNMVIRTDQASDPTEPKFVNEALVGGVAYDASGAAQACMGIASGDVDADGEVDLFVSNFYLEYYTLYRQQNGYFEDATASSGTAAATRPMLGFGTQFDDLQLDGQPDLLVLNGHIDDHTHVGVPEQMPAQLFAGVGDGRFEPLSAEQAGDYLGAQRLGRGLLKLDFDRDGLTDFVCCDLEEPVAILRNESVPVGDRLTIRLVGTQSDRNAFGARVTITYSDADGQERTITQQLVGGSGYQVTNERVLNFTLPPDREPDAPITAKVVWPSGIQQSSLDLTSSRTNTIIETP